MITNDSKILIINIFGIGDVLFTTPLLANLKQHAPGCKVSYLANARTAPILEMYEDIEKVFVYERDEFAALYEKDRKAYMEKGKQLKNDLRAMDFDVVFDLSMNSTFSFLSWFIRIPVRIGYNYKNRSRFLTHKIPLKGYEAKHVTDYYLDLLTQAEVPAQTQKMWIPLLREDVNWAKMHLQHNGIADNPPILVLPGGGASWGKDAKYKRWPAENYAKLADKMIENFSTPIILMGDKAEKELCSQVRSLMKHTALDLSGATSIMQLAAMSSISRLVVVNDGGPLHIAVAAGAQTASIFGPVDENVYGPYPAEGHIVVTNPVACRPCYHRFRRSDCDHVSCLQGLGVEDVFEKIASAL